MTEAARQRWLALVVGIAIVAAAWVAAQMAGPAWGLAAALAVCAGAGIVIE